MVTMITQWKFDIVTVILVSIQLRVSLGHTTVSSPHSVPWGLFPVAGTRCSGCGQRALGDWWCCHTYTGASASKSHTPDLKNTQSYRVIVYLWQQSHRTSYGVIICFTCFIINKRSCGERWAVNYTCGRLYCQGAQNTLQQPCAYTRPSHEGSSCSVVSSNLQSAGWECVSRLLFAVLLYDRSVWAQYPHQ